MKKLVRAAAIWILAPAIASAAAVDKQLIDPDVPRVAQTAPDSSSATTAPPPAAAAAAGDLPSSGSVASPAAATAQTVQTPEQQASESGFHLSIDLDHWLGTGTFVNSAYYSYLSGNLIFSPSYGFTLFGKKLMASGFTRVGLEYTRPDNETGRRVSWMDLAASLRAPAIYKIPVVGVSVSPGIGYTMPITMESWSANSYGSISASVGLSRKFFEKLGLRYGISAGKALWGRSFSGISARAADNRDAQGNRIFLCRAADTYCAVAGNNSDYLLINSLGADYQITEKWSASLGWMLRSTWRAAAASTPDQFTPQAVDSNGNPVARSGDGRSDLEVGTIGVAYAINDMFSLSAGVATFAPPKTNDNKAFRFPFFDFIGPADNNTTFSLGVSASL